MLPEARFFCHSGDHCGNLRVMHDLAIRIVQVEYKPGKSSFHYLFLPRFVYPDKVKKLLCLPCTQGTQGYCRCEDTRLEPPELPRVEDDIYEALFGFTIIISEPEVIENVLNELFMFF